MTALEVARWLRDGNSDLRLIDIRADSEFAAYHIPGAEHVAADELLHREWARDDAIVIYADGDDGRAREAALLLRARGVEHAYVLRRGLAAWVEQIAEPRLAALPATATPDERAARREHLELSRYFGGVPVVAPAGDPNPASSVVVPVPSRRSQAAAVARILRRGC